MTPSELVTITTDGTRIVSDLLVRRGASTLLVVPGFWRQRCHPVMRMITETLHGSGFTVCTIDNRGHGSSGGTFGFNTFESDDTIAVLESLRDGGLLDQGATILGFSAGGSIAISVAAKRPDLVAGLVLVSPVAEFKRVFPRPNPFRLNRQISLRAAIHPPRFWWFETKRRHSLEDAEMVSAPTCLIHARNDWLVHHSHSERIAARLVRHDLHIIDLDETHAERMFEVSETPWNITATFMIDFIGVSWSGA